jgi:hypothetical protein
LRIREPKNASIEEVMNESAREPDREERGNPGGAPQANRKSSKDSVSIEGRVIQPVPFHFKERQQDY